MDFETDIIIIGASGGIGQYLVDYYRGKPCNIYGTYNDHSEGLLRGSNIHYTALDVLSRFEMNKFVKSIEAFISKPVVIYTPGITLASKVHRYDVKEWEKTIAINLTGAMEITSKFIPIMRFNKFGRLIYFSSVLTQRPVEGTVAYTVTKAALEGMVKVVAKENAKYNITANTLRLGYHSIGMIDKVPEKVISERVLPNIVMGKLGNPRNILNGVEFLIRSDFVTGSTIDILGGM